MNEFLIGSMKVCLILLFVILLCIIENVTSLNFGGSGYGVVFDKSMIAVADYAFPATGEGLSISFWISSLTVSGFPDREMQLLTITTPNPRFRRLFGISLEAEENIVSFWLGEEKFQYQVSSESRALTPWNHHVISWNATSGDLKVYVNSAIVPVNHLTQMSQRLEVRVTTSVLGDGGGECGRTTGGYVPESSMCQFPFSVNNILFQSCAPWSTTPFIDPQAAPTPTARLKLKESFWCPLSSQYDAGNTTSRRRDWGFCSCYDRSPVAVNQTFDVIDARTFTSATYSSKLPLTTVRDVIIWPIVTCSSNWTVAISPSVALLPRTQSVLALVQAECSQEQAYDLSKVLTNLGVRLIVFVFSNAKKLVMPHQMQTGDTFEEVKARPRTRRETISRCSKTSLLLDRDLATSSASSSSSSCTWAFESANGGAPSATHYTFVVPANVSIQNWSWRVLRNNADLRKWIAIDKRRGSDYIDPIQTFGGPRQLVFEFLRTPTQANSNNKVDDEFQIVFDSPSNCSSIALAEFGLLFYPNVMSNIRSASLENKVLAVDDKKPEFSILESLNDAAGNGGGRCEFAPKILQSVVLSTIITSRVAQVLREIAGKNLFGMSMELTAANLDEADSLRLKTLFFSPSTATLQIVLGQLPIAAFPRYDPTRSLDRTALEELQIFARPFGRGDVDAAFASSELSSGTTVRPHSRYSFDVISNVGLDSGSSKQPLRFGSIDFTNNGTYVSSTLPPATSLVPSSLSIQRNFDDGDIIVVLSDGEDVKTIVLTNMGYTRSKQPLRVIITQQSNGAVSNIVARTAFSGEDDGRQPFTIQFQYAKRSPVSNWRRDSLNVQITETDRRSSISRTIRLVSEARPNPLPAQPAIVATTDEDYLFAIGGHISQSSITFAPVWVNATRIRSGQLFLEKDCMQLLNGGYYTFMRDGDRGGNVRLRYSPPVNPTLSVETLTWGYLDSTFVATVQFRSQSPSSPTATTFEQPYRFVRSDAIIGSAMFRLSFVSSKPFVLSGLQVAERPYFGRLFVQSSRTGQTIELVPSDLLFSAPAAPIAVVYASEIISFSPWMVQDDAGDTCSDPFSSVSGGLGKLLGETDGSAFSIPFTVSQNNWGFLRLRFPLKVMTSSIVIRASNAAYRSLALISMDLQHSSSFSSLDWTPCAAMRRRQLNCTTRAARCPETDSGNVDVSSETFTAVWQAPCNGEADVNNNDLMTTFEIPLCSLGAQVDTLRLDFDFTNAHRDQLLIDSIALVGVATTSAVEQQARTTTVGGDNVHILYEPIPGVVGTEQIAFRAQSTDCQSSDVEIVRLTPISGQGVQAQNQEQQQTGNQVTVFQNLPPVPAVNQTGLFFDLDFDFNYTSAIALLAQSVFGTLQFLRNVWPDSCYIVASIEIRAPGATMSSKNSGSVGSPGGNLLFQDTKTFSLSSAGKDISPSVRFVKRNLPGNLAKSGDLALVARLEIVNFLFESPSRFMPTVAIGGRRLADSEVAVSSKVSFDYAGMVIGGCGQASEELGPCSQTGRAYLYPHQCELTQTQGYQCSCYKAKSGNGDIVFSGEFCQYNTFSTCLGRGHPDENGICRCFDGLKFASSYCQKRNNNVTRQDLVNELEQTLDRFRFAVNSLEKVENVRVIVDNQTVQLVGDYLESQQVALIRLDLAVELNPLNNCHGNGRPIGSEDLTDTDCLCLEEFRPNKNCITKIICEPGQYIEGESCADCPIGYACETGIRKVLCPNGTFTVSDKSYRCSRDCIEAGFDRSYVEYDNTTLGLNHARCLPCPIGSNCENGLFPTLCPPGTYGSRALVCIDCNEIGLATFQSRFGALSCSQCPSGTIRQEGSPGRSELECTCEKGKWTGLVNNQTLTGVRCVDCPANGVCLGFDPISVRRSNSTLSNTPPRRRLRELQSSTDSSSMTFKNVGPYPANGFWGDPKYPSKFFACDDSCLGGANFSCQPGYHGRFCSVCDSGYQQFNGLCEKCPENANESAALVVFGIWAVLLLFAMINRASNEVRALDIALLYTQVANLVQQFSFVWPPPVNALNVIYGITDFDIDFVTYDCARSEKWTFLDKFYAQYFFVWYLGLFILLLNFVAFHYSKYRESKKREEEAKAELDNAMSQGKKAAMAAARLARFKKKQTMSADERIEDDETGGYVFGSQELPPASSSRFGGDSFVEKSTTLWGDRLKTILCCCCRKQSQPTTDNINQNVSYRTTSGYWGSKSYVFQEDTYIRGDPRVQAVTQWLHREFGLPSTKEQYKVYTQGQIAGWINLIRVVYNSLFIVCLEALFCIELADGTLVMRAWPEELCGSPVQVATFVLGMIGLVLYGVGFPLTVYVILTRLARQDKKASKDSLNTVGFLYEGYVQEHFRWELAVLFRRFALCLLVVTADGYPYLQAVFGGTIIMMCLSAQLYCMPYLSNRINTLESIVLTSIFFYLLCGVVFTGLHDMAMANPLDDSIVQFTKVFSTTLSYILLIVSLLTVAACFFVFFLEMREFFKVLVVERSLVRQGKSEDVALVRVLRNTGEIRLLKKHTAPVMPSKKKSRVKRGSLLFKRLDQDDNNCLNHQELLDHTVKVLGIPEAIAKKRIDQIFSKFDQDQNGSVDIHEFMAILKSAMPITTECELKRTIKPKYLIEWAKRSGSLPPSVVASFFQLDDLVKSTVADDSIVSVYRDYPAPAFYRKLAKYFPALIDWLACAKQADVKALKVILNELLDCQKELGPSGSFGKIIAEVDRGPVVWWLLEKAEESDREVFSGVLTSIAHANSENGRDLKVWTGSASSVATEVGKGTSVTDQNEPSIIEPKGTSLVDPAGATDEEERVLQLV